MADIELLNHHPSVYRAVRLEIFFPRKARLVVVKAASLFALVTLLAYVVVRIFTQLDENFLYASRDVLLLGLIFFFAGCVWILTLLDFYFLSVSRSVDLLTYSEKGNTTTYKLDFGGARKFLHLRVLEHEEINLARMYSFFRKSRLIRLLLLRLGLDTKEFWEFVKEKENGVLNVDQKEFLRSLAEITRSTGGDTLGSKECMTLLFDQDKNFEQFLFDRNIRRRELVGSADWAARFIQNERTNDRWWERTILEKIPGIGTSLGFGFTYTLNKYSNEIAYHEDSHLHFMAHRKDIAAMEEALSRSAQANAVLVGEPGVGKHTVLKGLNKDIFQGAVSPALRHKRMVNLDTAAITATAQTKGKLEELLIKIMNDATRAGNIILIIDNLPEFLDSSQTLGVNAAALLEPYFAGSAVQVVALADTDSFNRTMQPNGKLMKMFEKISITEPSLDETLLILEDIAEGLEARSGIVVTYQGLKTAVDLSDRYITQDVLPEKAVDLLDNTVASVASSGKSFLMPEDVQAVIEKEYKVPIAKAGEEESEKLLHMEEILHKRIINQKEAIKTVSNALRKIRSGLHTDSRPAGSFLFLGPTGVGKTETAKVLSEVYFGSEDNMTRFDMSEFQGMEGASKLIGSFGSHQPGILANKLRGKPFGLLLFDEFEKSSREVVNLFLQILEEGFFTDPFGRRVSARESMIIATSNAGSNLIWDLLQKGLDPATVQKEVIDSIRKEGIFSPEILNRFDAIVVYHPLNQEQLKQIAKILLNDLAKRLKERDIQFEITDELAEKVAEIGYDPVLGARPMRRAITDRVEQIIARKILEGTLKRGSSIKLLPADLDASA